MELNDGEYEAVAYIRTSSAANVGADIPRPVAAEIEFRRRQRVICHNGSWPPWSVDPKGSWPRGHDPIAAPVVNRLRDALLA